MSSFLPVVDRWFAQTLGAPTRPQREGWPFIRSGKHVLIAAPTGSGKTLAAFLAALDDLLRQGDALPDETRVLYVSPLRALSNDVQKNLQRPLAEIRSLDPSLPEVRVVVRTGDTTQRERTAMGRKPPHVLVTTPESFYILLCSASGRRMLRTVRHVIVDEIHALARDRRGSHLALSLERLVALAGEFQRIGLSATQRPIDAIARFLTGTDRACEVIDAGHLRELDLAVELPKAPLSAVCSNEEWSEIYARMVELIQQHRTTLVFVNTRKLSERIAAKLKEILGGDLVASHHGSLSKEMRLAAEQKLKNGQLRALVATASLELGIDIGDVDLVIQAGVTSSIATFLQRVGRAGHGVSRLPKGRIFPLTTDELVAAAGLLRAVRRGELDRLSIPERPLDILAQQIVASCVQVQPHGQLERAAETARGARDAAASEGSADVATGDEGWSEDELLALVRRAAPYRDLTREDFDATIALHTQGRLALLHRDGVRGRIMATRRARITATTSGGAIADLTQYQVVQEPEGVVVGSVHEDFAIESDAGDIFQLGTTSWRILKVEMGTVRVADAQGQPPTLPFWVGEAPARTRELAAAIAAVREHGADAAWVERECHVGAEAARQIAEYVSAGISSLGAVPTQERMVIERFFDESGGMQLVLHSPWGGRINRALGLALRKRFCRSFGFELQAAFNEDAIVLSLGPQHSFALEDVFDYLHPDTVRDVLVQAVLVTPTFSARWRWNALRSLMVPRVMYSRRTPSPILRMKTDDLLVQAWPQVMACGETLPPGDIAVPWEHPLVRQTLEDCLHEAMDIDGLIAVLRGLRDGRIARVAVDLPEPSAFARSVLAVRPYGFLDDAPLEERRTQAVLSRGRGFDSQSDDQIGALDPEAVARVREQAWPDPRNAEELHEALLWMGFVTDDEARPWAPWLEALAAAGRVVRDGDRWFAAEATREPVAVLRGRMEALGPVFVDENAIDPAMLELERRGVVLRVRLEGRVAFCDRRLLSRIHRYTVERLRREIQPVTVAEFLRFLGAWQHVTADRQLDGPSGVSAVIAQLAGFEVPAAAWEASVLPARVRGYRREWLDQLVLSGDVAWLRLWGSGLSAVRRTPLCLVPRADLESWLALRAPTSSDKRSAAATRIADVLRQRGATFAQDLRRLAQLLPSQVEDGLSELLALGEVTGDSFVALRQLLVPPSRRRAAVVAAGRWSLVETVPAVDPTSDAAAAEFVARRLLARYGVLMRRLMERERQPVPWRDVVRVLRRLELAGDVRGGRFVTGVSGEQYALPEAVVLMRQVRRGETVVAHVAAADPLNLRGIMTPDDKVPALADVKVAVG